jgi:exopolysaccharide production protein ExoZ
MFPLIQVLRGFAALAVVVYHSAGATNKYSDFSAPGELFTYGKHGVDLFFVISGFVIYHASSGVSAGEFATKRLKRIAPLYWLLTLAACAFVGVGTMSDQLSAQRVISSLTFTSFAAGRMPLVYVGWTLEYELYFYAVTAICLALSAAPWAAGIAFLSTMITFGALLKPTHSLAAFATNSIMLEFLAGVLLAQLWRDRPGRVELLSFSIACAAVLLAADFSRLALMLGASALVAAAVWFSRSAPRPLVQIGNASYSIYLVQVFAIPVVAKVVQRLAPHHHPYALITLASVAALFAGLLWYRFVERPLLLALNTISVPTGLRSRS